MHDDTEEIEKEGFGWGYKEEGEEDGGLGVEVEVDESGMWQIGDDVCRLWIRMR